MDNVCENNGTCVDQVGGFTCDCSDLFTGELCEIAVGTCSMEYMYMIYHVSFGNCEMYMRHIIIYVW